MAEPIHRVEMPFGRCPACDHHWQMSDCEFLTNGDTVTCPKCKRTIVLDDQDVTTTFTMRLEAE